jgi:gas vesicle protein
MKEKNLDELFRDKLLDYEQEPPAYVLENILSGVAGARRKRKLVYWRVVGVAAALLIAFVAGWQLNDSAYQKTKQAVNTVQPSTPKKSSETKNQAEKIMPANQATPAKPQLASTETNSPIRKNQSESIAQSLKSESRELAAEPAPVASNDESLLMVPLKSLAGLINLKGENLTSLQVKKSGDNSLDLAQKSIDQQIMEQNKQLLAVENQPKGKTRWLVGAQVSPEYNVARGSQSKAYASNMLNASSSSVDLGGGISVEYKKGKRWSLQSGVYYSGLGQTSGNPANSGSKDLQYALAGSNYFNTSVNLEAGSNRMSMNSNAGVIELSRIPSGLVVGNSLEDKTLNSAVMVSPTSFIQNFDYIEIPLYLRYTLIDARFDVVMLGGLSSNVLVGNQIYVDGASGKSLVGKTKDMEALNYSGTLGMGFKYGLSKRISVNIEPRIKYYLNSLNSNSSVTYKPYTIGVFTGLSYEF